MNRFGRDGLSWSALAVWPPLVLVLLSGCARPLMYHYVDTALPVVRIEDVKSVASPPPVQLLVEFRTRGSPNSTVTGLVKPVVFESVVKTGLFSQVSEAPVTGGRFLTIVIDNIALSGGAAMKEAGWNLALAPAGSVTDGYICTTTYSAPGSKANTKTVRHAIHSTFANVEGPKGVLATTNREALTEVVQQLTLNALRALRQDGL